MRIWLVLAAVAVLGIPAIAARHVTVEQLQQSVAEQVASGRPDGEVAQDIASLELTEQLTHAALNGILFASKPGPKTSQALQLLADTSSFLEPPEGEQQKRPRPDAPARQAMTSAMQIFATDTLRNLPDFLATRLTRSYDNDPIARNSVGWFPPSDLHLAGTYSQEITYRDGREVFLGKARDPLAGARKLPPSPEFISIGEFGPALRNVLRDAIGGHIVWSHWEGTGEQPVAVFHYEVPKELSHLEVGNCSKRHLARNPSDDSNSYCIKPAYHGLIYLNPATGAILRIVLEGEFKPADPITRAALSVDYGAVEIGDKSCYCPMHSVAILSVQSNPDGGPRNRAILSMNEVSFTNYHRFGSTVDVVPEDR